MKYFIKRTGLPALFDTASMLHQSLFLQQLRKSNQKEAAPHQNPDPNQLVFIWPHKLVPYEAMLKKRPVFCPDKYWRCLGDFGGGVKQLRCWVVTGRNPFIKLSGKQQDLGIIPYLLRATFQNRQ